MAAVAAAAAADMTDDFYGINFHPFFLRRLKKAFGGEFNNVIACDVLRGCRFIMIAHPSSYPRIYTRKTVAAMVALIWFFSFALLVPTLTKRWGNVLSKSIDTKNINILVNSSISSSSNSR